MSQKNISSTIALQDSKSKSASHLPWSGLLALAMAGFICILTESVPAGLLLQISAGLSISESLAGQLVTFYALGSLVAAIPIVTATRGWNRRPLLLLCIVGFFVFNTITAISSVYLLTIVARFFAGVSAGVLWGITAGYARRLVPDKLKGKAMAVAMVGTPLALALGVPIGTFLGSIFGWRIVFLIMSLMALVLVFWILWKLPDFSGQDSRASKQPLNKVFFLPGIRPILIVVLAWVLAHNILYIYIAPYLASADLKGTVELMLLIFGVASVIGIWLIGIFIDQWLRVLILLSLAGFALASVLIGIAISFPTTIYLGVAIWGLTFGGAATLLQTASAEAAGENADVAQAMLVTSWNLAIGGGGVVGGIFLEIIGIQTLPWAILLLILSAFIVVKFGFLKSKKQIKL
ncbi:MFS transporter [Niallia sp. 01092]|uniref:MFS transporter n=1 Tax=unclassified Niallia TaxID=2837522 RepID=UPI003FD14ACE